MTNSLLNSSSECLHDMYNSVCLQECLVSVVWKGSLRDAAGVVPKIDRLPKTDWRL